jgi:hypothetical protein
MRTVTSLGGLSAVFLAACAPIQHSSVIAQQLEKPLTVGPGDLVARVTYERDLENVVGRADVFGGKTTEGVTELYFSGVEADGTIVFYRKGLTILTNETTMSRSPVTQSVTTLNGTATAGTGNITNVRASAIVTTNRPPENYHIVIPQDAVAIRLTPETKSFQFEGHIVSVLSAAPLSLSYQLTKTGG